MSGKAFLSQSAIIPSFLTHRLSTDLSPAAGLDVELIRMLAGNTGTPKADVSTPALPRIFTLSSHCQPTACLSILLPCLHAAGLEGGQVRIAVELEVVILLLSCPKSSLVNLFVACSRARG